MSHQETPRTFTPEQSQAMYDALRRIAQVRDGIIRHDERVTRRKIAVVKAIKDAEKLLDSIDNTQSLATPPAATEPAPEAGDGGRSLKNRNTENFEPVAEYHRGNFYTAPVLYHNREIMCWHVYDKTADKDKYCVARNIRTRLLAIAHIDRLNTRARGGA